MQEGWIHVFTPGLMSVEKLDHATEARIRKAFNQNDLCPNDPEKVRVVDNSADREAVLNLTEEESFLAGLRVSAGILDIHAADKPEKPIDLLGFTAGILDIHAAKSPTIPAEVWELLNDVEDPGSGAEQVGEFFVAWEGFTDVCWADLPKKVNMKKLAQETLITLAVDNGVNGRVLKTGWLRGGVYGQDDVVYAIWWAPDNIEANLHAAEEKPIDLLLKRAKQAVQDDPRWEGYESNPALATQLGDVQRAVDAARRREDLELVWEQYALTPPLETLEAEVADKGKEQKKD